MVAHNHMQTQTADDLLAALDKVEAREEMRNYALSNTINFARLTGDNPWDFDRDRPRFDPETGFYPWCPYAEKTAKYLDKKPTGLAKPIKPVSTQRDHLKTTIIGVALARRALINPNLLFAVIADTDPKAQLRLKSIADIYKSEIIQELFPEKLYPDDGKARFRYGGSAIKMKRKRERGQPVGARQAFSRSEFVRMTNLLAAYHPASPTNGRATREAAHFTSPEK